MDYLTVVVVLLLSGPVGIIALQLTVSELLDTNIPYFLFLLFKGELNHFVAKRRVVRGDLVLISFKGKLRKAYINDLALYNNTVTLTFEEDYLNTRETIFNRFHLARIKLPEYYSRASTILYSGENK